MSNLFNLFWIFLILVSLQPVLQRQLLAQARKRALSQIAHERGSAVMTLIHRQETMSILGFPVMRYIDVDDSESVLRESAYDLMALYPQPRGRQSAVEYVPSRPRPELPPASRPRD